MAVNPMQRKARNSFLLGMIITLLITGAIIALLFLQFKKLNDEKAAEEAAKVSVYVLSEDVESGEEITMSMIQTLSVNKNLVPSNAYSSSQSTELSELLNKVDKDGNEVPVIAKVDMKKNTVITQTLVSDSDDIITDDLRRQDYNMISLPLDLMSGDAVDIRLMLPSGQDFIVISKVKVEVPTNEDGSYVADTIFVNLREDEILCLSSAIVEAYGINGAKLYATKYVETGIQEASTPTYTPNAAVAAEINNDPNIVEKAKTELKARSDRTDLRNQYINSEINNAEDYNENVQEGMNTDITNSESARKLYLETLGY